ncbi:MAG: hypothetical protein IZT55_02440 [Anaerolineae bacterium]|nr:hypothetical protein [Anaerolineae bacterium]
MEMYTLFQKYYDLTTFENFTHDLNNKNWVIVIKCVESQQIIGFSTLAFFESNVKNKPIGVLYSGDTIIDKKYWGTPELPKNWIKTVLSVGKEYPEPLYWLLISSGYKTYRFLSVFYKEFYPCYDKATPKDSQSIMNQLAKERFGEDYYQSLGIVRFSTGATPLKAGIADVKPNRLQDEHVKFFLEKNPGHINGDELVCLTVIHQNNFTPAGKRMAR